MFDQIEKLKHDFTDQYVVVVADRPELARFAGLTGQVKTVNMSGKALVEFDGRLNIGWYDIGLDFLKVVPKPEPKPAEEKPAKKAAPAAKTEAPKPAAPAPAAAATVVEEKKPAPAPAPEPVAEKPAAAKPAGEAKKMSTADILAALKKKA